MFYLCRNRSGFIGEFVSLISHSKVRTKLEVALSSPLCLHKYIPQIMQYFPSFCFGTLYNVMNFKVMLCYWCDVFLKLFYPPSFFIIYSLYYIDIASKKINNIYNLKFEYLISSISLFISKNQILINIFITKP